MLRGWIDYYRDTVRAQVGGLGAGQLAATIPGHPAVMTLGGMLKHLTFVEQWWFTIALHDRPPAGFWADVDWDADPDWEWRTAADDSPEELRALWEACVARSRAHVAAAYTAGGPEAPARLAWSSGEPPALRRLMVDLIEEYARHTGHADLIRESIDGLVGEGLPG